MLAIAPMLRYTDQHYRYFMRCLSKNVVLYTEMLMAPAVLYGQAQLTYFARDEPVVLQLGGANSIELAAAARLAIAAGYTELNFNCGCPSPRAQQSSFGAALMEQLPLLLQCWQALAASSSKITVSVKHRIGIGREYDYTKLANFVAALQQAGCQKIIVHARNAILTQLSPKRNLSIPPLCYEFVYRLKQDFPALTIVINGGIKTTVAIHEHLKYVDGVMLGRAAYHNPYLASAFDREFFAATTPIPSRKDIAVQMVEYLQTHLRNNGKMYEVLRHLSGLYHSCAQAKIWRTGLVAIARSNDIADYLALVNSMDE